MSGKSFDAAALGKLLIDFTQNGLSQQGNSLFEANPGGAPCNVLVATQKGTIRSIPSRKTVEETMRRAFGA